MTRLAHRLVLITLLISLGLGACDCGGNQATGVDAAPPRGDGGVVPFDAAGSDAVSPGHDASSADAATGADRLGSDSGGQDAAVLPPCDDDALEDNDDASQATQMAPGTVAAQICASDADWYRFDVNAGMRLVVRIDFVNDDGDLDLVLYDEAGTELDASRLTGDTEEVEHVTTTAGAFFAEVSGYSGAQGAYTLVATVEEAPANDGGVPTCADDSYEDNDTLASASSVAVGTYEGQICAGDPDFFGVNLNVGDVLTVDLSISSASDNLDMQVLAPDGSELGASTGTGTTEQVVVTATAAGRHAIRVYGASASDESAYELSVANRSVVPTCQDDGFEDNDDASSAAAISAGQFDGQICSGDEDWFAVTLAAGDVVHAELRFAHAAGDLSLELVQPDMQVAAQSQSSDDNEAIEYSASAGGVYYIHVLGVAGAENSYQLALNVGSTSSCANDGFEANDSSSQAASLGAGSYPAMICPGDVDWYSVAVNNGDTVQVDLTFNHADGNIDLKIFDASGQTLLGSSLSTDDNERASVVASSSGSLLVQVLGAASVENDYTIDVTITPATSACTDDGLEDNDDLAGAAALQAGTYNAHICPGDDDWYSLSLNAGDRVVADLSFTHAAGNIDAALFDSGGQILSSGVSTDDNEHLDATVVGAGTYYLVIVGVGDVDNAYSLDLAITADTSCRDDAFEDNDTFSSGAPLAEGSYSATICSGDDDFFVFDLNVGDAVDATIRFAVSNGDLDLQLLSPSGNTIAASDTATSSTEQLNITASSAGRYGLRVFGYQGASNDYDLDLVVTRATPACRDDGFEENDSRANAALIEASTISGQVCSGDEDWFGVALNAQDKLNLSLLFTHADGDLDLSLYRPDGTVARSSYSVTDNEEILNFEAASAGTYTVRVRGAFGAENVYQLVVGVVPFVPPCPEDDLEDNDTAATATPYPGSPVNAQICPADSDYFAIPLNAGDSVDIDLSFVDADGDLDMVLRDPQDSIVANAVSVTDDEHISAYVAPTAGVYHLRVYGIAGAENAYGLTVTITPATPVCAEDAFEDNDTQATATTGAGASANGQICAADPDWFAVELNAGDSLRAELVFTNADGDLDMRLHDSSGTALQIADSASNNERIDFTATNAGTYAIEVYGFRGAENSYTLNLSVTSPTPTCADDAYEDNDTLDGAVALPQLSFADAQVCSNDNDYYSLELQAGETLAVNLQFTDADGDLDLKLLNAAGNVVASSTSTSDDERISYPVRLAGTYTIWVYGFRGAENSYALSTTINAAQSCPADDNLEPNDDRASARSAVPGSLVGIICVGDDDYYKIDVPEGGLLRAALTFATNDGDLDLYLYDASGNRLDSSLSVSSREQVDGYSDAATTFYVRVHGFQNQESAAYSLDLSIEQSPFYAAGSPKGCPGDDGLSNGLPLDSAQMRSGDEVSGVICAGTMDFYAVSLQAGERLDVSARFAHTVGDLNLGLLDPAGDTVAQSSSTSDDENLSYTVPDAAPGTYFVVVSGASGSENWYALSAAISGGGGQCINDGDEPNDSTGSAHRVAPGFSTGGQICSGDDDYFIVTVGAGQTLTATLLFADDVDCDLDLRLLDSSGEVDRSIGTTDREQVSVTAGSLYTQYDYYVRVYSAFLSDACAYTLDVNATGP